MVIAGVCGGPLFVWPVLVYSFKRHLLCSGVDPFGLCVFEFVESFLLALATDTTTAPGPASPLTSKCSHCLCLSVSGNGRRLCIV